MSDDPESVVDWFAMGVLAKQASERLAELPEDEQHEALGRFLGLNADQLDHLLALIEAGPEVFDPPDFEPEVCGNVRFGYTCQRAAHDGTYRPELDDRINLHACMTDRGYMAHWRDGVAGVTVRKPSPDAVRIATEARVNGDVL